MGAWVMPIGALGRPPQGGTCHSVSSTQRGFRLYSSPPLHQLSSESRHCGVSLDCLISRIIHHLERSWPPWGTQGRPAGGRIAFQQNRRALRPAGTEAASPDQPGEPKAREGATRDEKTVAPFWEDDEKAA